MGSDATGMRSAFDDWIGFVNIAAFIVELCAERNGESCFGMPVFDSYRCGLRNCSRAVSAIITESTHVCSMQRPIEMQNIANTTLLVAIGQLLRNIIRNCNANHPWRLGYRAAGKMRG